MDADGSGRDGERVCLYSCVKHSGRFCLAILVRESEYYVTHVLGGGGISPLGWQ